MSATVSDEDFADVLAQVRCFVREEVEPGAGSNPAGLRTRAVPVPASQAALSGGGQGLAAIFERGSS